MNPNKMFDMHEVNRLIMREQIPGFKMLPKEKAYLEEYRKALKEYHGYEQEDPEESRARAEREAKIEARKAAVKAKKANKKHNERTAEEPTEPVETTVEEAEQLDVTVVEPIVVEQVPEAEIVEDKPTEE